MPGVGKSQVSMKLKDHWGIDAYELNLDDSENLEKRLQNAINHNYVIVELFSGRSRVTNTQPWLGMFNEAYMMLSVVLKVSFDMGFSRANMTTRINPIPDKKKYACLYSKFETRQREGIFQKDADIREISIDAESGDWSLIAQSIITELQDNMGLVG